MSSVRPSSDSRTTLTLLGMQVGVSLLTQLVVRFFERLWGSRYSSADLRRHHNLGLAYVGNLQNRPLPAFWTLSSDDKPNLVGLAQCLAERSPSDSPAPYHRQSDTIAGHVRTYLTARARRWFGKGSPGDLLDLFMCEWLDFSAELSRYPFNSTSQQKLQARIDYIEAVLKHEDLFEAGRFSRKKNKFAVMRSIRDELRECKEIADEQVSRVSAGEKMTACSDSLSKLLWDSAQSLYFARKQAVHDATFDLNGYLAGTYLKVQETHTGQMLKEVVARAGLGAFGKALEEKESTQQELETESPYYEADFRPKKGIQWTSKESDLPSWIPKEERSAYLIKTQDIGECMLRLARIKRLFEQARQFANELGDAWVYEDKRGKLSFEGLLFLLDKELQLFKKRYNDWYKTQNDKRCAGSVKRSAEHLNHNMVDTKKKEIDTHLRFLQQTLQELQTQMRTRSYRKPKPLDAQKEKFYQTVVSQVERSYPEDYPRFKALEGPLPLDNLLADLDHDKSLLDEKYLRAQEPRFWLARLFPGESYIQWRKRYLQGNNDFQEFLGLLKDLQDDFYRGRGENTEAIQEKLAQMKRRADAEQPVWRCGWFYLQAGWPFKQGEAQKIRFLLREFDILSQRVDSVLKKMPERGKEEAEEKMSTYTARPSVKRPLTMNQSTLFPPESKYIPSQGVPVGRNPFADFNPFLRI